MIGVPPMAVHSMPRLDERPGLGAASPVMQPSDEGGNGLAR